MTKGYRARSEEGKDMWGKVRETRHKLPKTQKIPLSLYRL